MLVKMKDGRERNVSKRDAKILVALGKGQYITRNIDEPDKKVRAVTKKKPAKKAAINALADKDI